MTSCKGPEKGWNVRSVDNTFLLIPGTETERRMGRNIQGSITAPLEYTMYSASIGVGFYD